MISIVLLSLIDSIICSVHLNFYFFGTVIIFILSLFMSALLVVYSLIEKTPHENQKKRDQIIEANKKVN